MNTIYETVAGSTERVARAQAYASRLSTHAAEVRARLDAANDATALGHADAAAAGPIRGELIVVERQLAEARAVLADIEAEHGRHVADLRAAHGPDGEARARLRERQAERDTAQATADQVSDLLTRATAHAEGVEVSLTAARAAEARHDVEAVARLHAALRDGSEPPTAPEAFTRISPALEDDLRAARATVGRLTSEHATELAAVAEAERQVRGAVDAVMAEDAEAVAREVTALDARMRVLRNRLKAYAERKRGDYVAREPARKLTSGGWWEVEQVGPAPRVVVSPLVTKAKADPLPEPSEISGPAQFAAASLWDAYAADLTRDAEATVDFSSTPLPPLPAALIPPPSLPFPSSWDAVLSPDAGDSPARAA